MRSDDFLDDDVDERDRRPASAIFASGWFRAVLVLGVLAITLVVAVPYVLRWMEPGSAKVERQVARPLDLRPTGAPPAPVAAPTQAPAPVAPAAPSSSVPAPAVSAPVPLPAASAPSSSGPTAAAPAPRRPSLATAPAPPVTAAAPSKVAAAPTTERLVPAPAPAVRERETAAAKPAAADDDSRKTEPAARKPAPPEAAHAKAAPAARGGDFWVQVGAFQRERNAEALVRSIRDEMKMPAQMSRRARAETVAAAAPRHEVFVTDAPVGTVNAALRGHGSAQAVRGGVAVQPPLELKEAVALSRRLSGEGLSVKIRRVGGETAAVEPATTYVVRVGGYATRAQAEAARRELARKGVPGFVADTPTR